MDDQIRQNLSLSQNQSEQGGLNIKDLFYKYVRFLPLIVISIALSLFVAYVYLRYATLIYTSTGSVVVEEKSSRSNDRLDVLFESESNKNIQNEIEYLQSRQLMSRVVTELDLNFTYIAIGKIKELNIYKSSPFRIETLKIEDSTGFKLKIDFVNNSNFTVNGSQQKFNFGDVFKNEYGVFRLVRHPEVAVGNEYEVIWQPTRIAASEFTSLLTITPKANTGILVLKLQSTNPQLAADVINQLMIEYQEATIEDKNAATQKQMAFVNKRVEVVQNEVDSISSVQQGFIKRHSAFDLQTQSSNYLARIEAAYNEKSTQQSLLDKAYQIETDLLSGRTSIPVPSTLGLDDPTLNELVQKYNDAQIEKRSLQENAPRGNIALKQQEELIGQLTQNIQKNLRSVKNSYSAIINRLQNLTASSQAQLGLMPELQQELSKIDRELEGKLEILKSLLVKREETAIVLASTISNIKVLQEATANTIPIKPNRRNVQMLAALIGLLIPALFIFLLEVMNDKVGTRYDIERLTSAPVLGEVGHSYNKETLVVTSSNRGVVAEQFRIIRSNLQYVLNTINRPVILVTSSFSGEGKSFASTNTGAVMALAGKKTIILEFDIRKPKILSQLHVPKKPGLTNYLLGKVKLEDLPIPMEGYDNLYLLACGPVPPNPAELLLDQRLNDLFDYLRANFDVVIIDTAPVGMVSDAMTLSKFADCTLYIVRQGHTFKRQISLIDEFHREGKLPKVSIILNDVKIRTGYGYYGYGRYGYGHGYSSSYYEEETPPPNALSRWFGWIDTKNWKAKKRKRSKV